MSDNNVRLQNLRDFTVQIRNADDQIVGTGIAVSTDGKIVTCAHVVEAAGVDPRSSNGAEVSVHFPQVRGREERKRKAVIVKFFPKHDDDIVMLKLIGGNSPLAPEQIPKLGTAQTSAGHAFKGFGYRKLSNYQGLPADGHIVDYAEKPEDKILLWDPVMLQSQHIDSGMSGSGVLDVERNLVVGIVYETYDSAGWQKDRDTAFAVDTHVLTFDPFDFEFEEESYPLRPAPEPKFDKKEAEAAVFIKEKYSWHYAPSVLQEWIGRDQLLEQITADWNDPKKHVTGLIGFGGEGKSSLARKWVADVIARSREAATKQSQTNEEIASQSSLAMTKPDGVFWWGFYENRSVDEFLEAALNYMSGGRIDLRAVPSSNLRAQIIGAMLGTGRYLFVLDGLEVMQYQEGDQYGLLQSNDLRDLLTFFARPDNQSFCLITSRAPLLDLMDYTTYTHRDVERLSEEDGRALLRRLGVQGSDDELDKVVADWDGHALTLNILAAYLAERYKGDIKHLADIPVPTADEPRYERVHRVLRRYDEHLTDEEREFLKLFSVFRLPVQESAFEKVFEPLLKKTIPNSQFTDSRITEIVNHLVTYRLIRHDEHDNSYTTHPLIRNHYYALLAKSGPSQEKATHEQIKDYYLSIAGDTPQYPTLDDLKPLIEVVHHACQAGAYDEAISITYQRIYGGYPARILVNQIGAWETALTLMYEFFDNNNTTTDPKVSNYSLNNWIVNEIGLCLMNLGHLGEAVPFLERNIKGSIENQDWSNASVGYENLASLHVYLGELDESAKAVSQKLALARRAKDNWNECIALANQAWVFYLLGDMEKAGASYQLSEKILKKNYSSYQYLFGFNGVRYAKYLSRTTKSSRTRRVIDVGLEESKRSHAPSDIALFYCVLGDLNSNSGNYTSANAHYDKGLMIIRNISYRPVLIEALLARGNFFAKHMKNANAAFGNLNEALGYCVESGYRIYEADVRVALAWAYLANGEKEKAKASAERAKQMSNEMGYHWGKVDAEEILGVIARSDA